jgi:REP element-mobilizing transposase RayT
MKYEPKKHRRRSLRLKDYDYAQSGTYFVTIVAQERTCLFGNVLDGALQLNDAGRMVQVIWSELSLHYPGVATDAFAVMPNHFHGIVTLVGVGPCAYPEFSIGPCAYPESGQPQGVAPTRSLPDVVRRFKSLTTKRYSDGVKQSGWVPFPGKLWQRNYYEHIIRNERSLDRIREYILNNPLRWFFDPENPAAMDRDPILRNDAESCFATNSNR